MIAGECKINDPEGSLQIGNCGRILVEHSPEDCTVDTQMDAATVAMCLVLQFCRIPGCGDVRDSIRDRISIAVGFQGNPDAAADVGVRMQFGGGPITDPGKTFRLKNE